MCQSDSAKIRKAQKNRDYRRKGAPQLRIKNGKNPIPQSGSNPNNDSITIASLLLSAESSIAVPRVQAWRLAKKNGLGNAS